MAFRPCIDLRAGRVVQIVGGTLTDDGAQTITNYVSDRAAAEFAALYRRDALGGGHVIMLGPGNEDAARAALVAYPGGLQIGGGITPENAAGWLDAGASHVIVTSYLFPGGIFSPARLHAMTEAVGRSHLVVDLSCRRTPEGAYHVATDRWRTLTDTQLSADTIALFEASCAELLIHAADVEGKCEGIDEELVSLLGKWVTLPTTYAGGARRLEDIAHVEQLSGGKVDLTIGSALDIFGGSLVHYEDAARLGRKSASILITDYLWDQLHDLFDTDDGMLPDIELRDLRGNEVEGIYAFLRSRSEIIPPGTSFWSNTEQRSVPVDTVENAARLVVVGEGQPFHVLLHGLTFAGATIPDLGVFVWQNEIGLDYRMGPDWNPTRLRALFECLYQLQQIAPTMQVGLPQQDLLEMRERFIEALQRYYIERLT